MSVRELLVVGLSWRTAPVALREKLAFTDTEMGHALEDLRSQDSIAEAMILSTCNRVEVYSAIDKSAPKSAGERAVAAVRNYLASNRGVDSELLSEALYERTSVEALHHIFRVASSLDSMVVGESQILGQLKDAYGRAVSSGSAGATISRCLERAFRVAKRVRTETEIAQGGANVASVAVEVARRVFDLSGKSVLLLGAGKMGTLAARHLRGAGAARIAVANRSIEKAVQLAATVEGVAQPWTKLPELLAGSDVVISSTGSTEPILNKKLVRKALKKRRYKPIVIVDIAVPRDADPEIGTLDGVYLFDIDDLEKVVAENLRLRGREADAAEQLVRTEVTSFEAWSRGRSAVPTIKGLREHFTRVASEEADRMAAAIAAENDPKKRERLAHQLSQRIANKLLHTPMLALKGGSDVAGGSEEELEELIRTANALFALGDEREPASEKVTVAEQLTPSTNPSAGPSTSSSTRKVE